MTDLIVDRVSKSYRIRRTDDESRPATLAARLRALRRRDEEFRALHDVSFEVARGETLGIIGDNGAGKSTILKLLSGVTAPTSGQITINGRLSALIEVGSGFHPELTGRENVFLSGSILGMRRREFADKLDRIIEFAGVRAFIDTPVKRYSSGMYLRLGFSIAAHLEPDILLLDEVLAVGDAEFQAKCIERVNQLHRHGRTIVFISHDLAAVERLCSRVVFLSRGRVLANGPAREVIAMYQEMGRTRTPAETVAEVVQPVSGEIAILSVSCVGGEGEPVDTVVTGGRATVRLAYDAREPVEDAVFELYVYSLMGAAYGPWCQLTTADPSGGGMRVDTGPGVVEFEVPEFGFQPGDCYISARIARPDQPAGTAIDWRQEVFRFPVRAGRSVRGTFYLPHRWRIIRAETEATTGVRSAR
jgi:ABC-type polysaccharide/polyol phosphate transport system ATPase subunit